MAFLTLQLCKQSEEILLCRPEYSHEVTMSAVRYAVDCIVYCVIVVFPMAE